MSGERLDKLRDQGNFVDAPGVWQESQTRNNDRGVPVGIERDSENQKDTVQ